MKILLGGGLGMRVDDGDAYWTLADTLQAAGHVVFRREAIETGGKHPMTIADVVWAQGVIVYSYACATLWKLEESVISAGYRVLVALCPVNDVWMGQIGGGGDKGGGVWHVKEHVARAVCYQVTTAVPVSQPFRNVEAQWSDFGMHRPATRVSNIKCDALVKGFGPVSQHTRIKDDGRMLAALAGEFGVGGGA